MGRYATVRRFSEAGREGIRRREEVKRERLLAFGFWARVDKSGGPDACWPWTGSRQTDRFGKYTGYGFLSISGKVVYVHRLALASVLGRPIAPGMVAMHSCDNPPCCNPRHLYVGDQRSNMRDMARRGRHVGRRGEPAANRKLTTAQVEALRANRAAGMRYIDLAAEFGVSIATAHRVASGQTPRVLVGVSMDLDVAR